MFSSTHRLRLTATFAATILLLPACSSTQDARTEGLEDRIERQDDRIEARSERRRMRAEAEDQRYNDWYNRIMGRPSGY